MHNNTCNYIVERSNEQIQLLATYFVIFATNDSGVDHHNSVRCTVTVYRSVYIPRTRVVHMTLLVTGKESSTQVYWVGRCMCACENVCDIQVYENYPRKPTKDRDLKITPVLPTCTSCQIRLFLILWLNIEPLQPISSKTMCQAKKLEPDISSHSIHVHQIYIALSYLI